MARAVAGDRWFEVGALVDEGAQQPRDEQRASPGPFHQPRHQRVRHGNTGQGRRQLCDPIGGERVEGEPSEQTLLLQPQQYLVGHAVLPQLGGPGGEQDQDRALDQVAGEVIQGFPGRSVGQVDVVEHDHGRRPRAEAAEEPGQGTEQTDPGRLGADTAPLGGPG